MRPKDNESFVSLDTWQAEGGSVCVSVHLIGRHKVGQFMSVNTWQAEGGSVYISRHLAGRRWVSVHLWTLVRQKVSNFIFSDSWHCTGRVSSFSCKPDCSEPKFNNNNVINSKTMHYLIGPLYKFYLNYIS